MTEQHEKYNIICLSNQLWDWPNWTNKKHVMLRLAKQGHTVIFVDPPINTGNVFLTQIKRGLWGFKRLITQISHDPSGAYIFTPLNIIPVSSITSRIHIFRINLLASKIFRKENKTILWVYHVQISDLKNYLDGLKYDVLVYDCVDNYVGFPEVKAFYRAVTNKSGTQNQEEYLATKANIIFATAPGLLDKLRKFNSNVFFTPNVGDYEKFKDVDKLKNEIPDDIKSLNRPIIGFTGSLDQYKFDLDLYKKLLFDHPNYSFVLIGQIALKDKEATLDSIGLSGYKNLYFLGSRDFKIIQYYFAGFDAYIIPYQLNEYTVEGCFPIKFHDSLAAGLPTIVTDMPAYLPFKDVCYISKTYQEFSDNLTKALEEDNYEKIKARKEVAKKNNWEGKVESMLNYINIYIKDEKNK